MALQEVQKPPPTLNRVKKAKSVHEGSSTLERPCADLMLISAEVGPGDTSRARL
jgi:hypothetical protein